MAHDGIDSLSREAVARALGTVRYGRSLEVLAETDSTNDDARAAASGGAASGHVVVADYQRRGRGSKGRSWESPAGTDLYLSIVDRPALPLHALPPLTLAVGLGVARAVDALLEGAGRPTSQVKWPNDVWIDSKKVAGILIEGASVGETMGPVVIGIGLNVNRLRWPAELTGLATSLRQERPDAAPLDRAAALARLLGDVEAAVDDFVAAGAARVVEQLSPRLALRGERVRCDGVDGILDGISPEGALRLRTAAGPRELIAGTLERA